MSGNPFHPRKSSTVTLAVTAASANVALVNPAKGPFQVRVVNAGTKTAFINDGNNNSAAAVVANDLPILAGATEVLTFNSLPELPVTYMAAICGGADTTTLYFSVGEGI